MDWLDEQADKLKNRFQSLKGSLGLYILFGALTALSGVLMVNALAVGWERLLLGEDTVLRIWEFMLWKEPIDIPDALSMPFFFLKAVRYGSIFLFSTLAVAGIASNFYRKKIQQPILILRSGIDAIKKDDLGKPVFYQSGDEFEAIFQGFEEMRQHLIESRRQILLVHEEQRKVNAVFSHDLRTPLSVIQNNVELIETFFGTGEMDAEMLKKSLGKIKHSATRLETFSETMREIQKVDEINLVKEYQPLKRALKEVASIGESLAKEKFLLQADGDFDRRAGYDLQVVLETAENLISNAIRFADETVRVTLQVQPGYLYLFVQDDGPGFTKEALTEATGAYYSGDKSNHFGLGLTVSAALAKKHGGTLRLSNSVNGGAIVTAVFAL